jgi:hypothetical protein
VGCRLAAEHQERCLKRILGVLGLVKDAAADAQDHRPMPPHQGGEGGLIALAGKTLQQLAVGVGLVPLVRNPGTKVL